MDIHFQRVQFFLKARGQDPKEANQEPTFAIIEQILEVNTNVYFWGCEFQTSSFDSYYHAYKVYITKTPNLFISIDTLPKAAPALLVGKKDTYYVATRYD